MGLREWIEGLRKREDDSEIRRAQEMSTETAQERVEWSEGIEDRAADEAAREHGGEPPTERP
jgi:hypothetical protein